jgi:hypothetical protein
MDRMIWKRKFREHRVWQTKFGSFILLVCLLCPQVFSFLSIFSGTDASLPACCRVHGKHNCAWSGYVTSRGNAASTIAQIAEKCPYAPAVITSFHDSSWGWPIPWLGGFSGLHENSVAASSFEFGRAPSQGAHQKRGPPSFRNLA